MAPEVFLFFDSGKFASSREIRQKVEKICSTEQWSFQPKAVPIKRDPSGRPVSLVELDVAKHLYPRAHRARIACLVLGADPRVPIHPIESEVLRFRRHVPLRRFLAYKSCWIRLNAVQSNNSWAGEFRTWCSQTNCEGELDPRCLPFHVFRGAGRDLQLPARRVAFDEQYGFGGFRRDEQNVDWALNPHAFHGTESLHVSGYLLPTGFHWDVSSNYVRIQTPKGVWEGRGHINIYPDAHVRQKGSNFRKIL